MSFTRHVICGLLLSAVVHSVALSQDSASDRDLPSAPEVSADRRLADEGRGISSSEVQGYSSEALDQDSKYELTPGEDPNNHLFLPFAKHLADDQRAFWMAPTHFHTKDLQWGLPFAGVTAGFIASDSWLSKQIPLGQIQRSKTISDYGAYSFIGAGAGAFIVGHWTGNDRMSEAGFLSGEAASRLLPLPT